LSSGERIIQKREKNLSKNANEEGQAPMAGRRATAIAPNSKANR